MAETNTVGVRIGRVGIMCIQHKRPHACVPLSVKASAVVTCGVKDAILMGCKSVVCFRKGHVVVGA